MTWFIRCKAIQNNKQYGIEKNRVYRGTVIGDNADEAAIAIHSPKGSLLYFADSFKRDFVLVSCRNADIVMGYDYGNEISELMADGNSYEDAVELCEFIT